MDWLKKLQERYRNGKITKDVYEVKVAEGLEDEVLNQEEHDAALKFDPKAPEGGELIYSQEDVDRIVVTKSRTLLRKELRAAGIELDVDNKGLMAHVINLVKGDGKKPEGITEADLALLRKDASKVKTLGEKLKDLTLENTVLRNAGGQYTPVNPNQVVRALRDYVDEIEYDENDVPDKRSIELVLRKLLKAEPNLFKSSEDTAGADNDDEDHKETNGTGFSGKTPGGGAGGGTTTRKSKEDAALADMLASVGIKAEESK